MPFLYKNGGVFMDKIPDTIACTGIMSFKQERRRTMMRMSEIEWIGIEKFSCTNNEPSPHLTYASSLVWKACYAVRDAAITCASGRSHFPCGLIDVKDVVCSIDGSGSINICIDVYC
jgi:hypothetical protein